MRKFHTYVDTPQGLSRGWNELKKNALLDVDLDKQIKQVIATKGSCNLLEIGAGKGFVLLDLCSKYSNIKCVGINRKKEHGPSNAEEIMKAAKDAGLELKNAPIIIVADATKLPFNNLTFDIVISQVSFVHVEDKLKAISEVSRVLSVGGSAYLDVDSWEMKKHKPKGPTPAIYKKVWENLGMKATPRIILEKDGKLVDFKSQIEDQKNFQIKVQIVSKEESSDGTPNFKQIMHMKKLTNSLLNLPYKRNAAKSKEFTNLEITDHNPASFGVVDYYIYRKQF